ncbi:hypothetical protein TrLO_g5961 [Triparma laevis f. longispina]|uniref:Uncharacterized protein n=1 Tax=Triparma laevis f. longispina TaxID=1714387 RepID=A0A9W6ZV11_9STRA|nr:hypothetical protein TrLO_g5961 [Triparma laevis f. longispina]
MRNAHTQLCFAKKMQAFVDIFIMLKLLFLCTLFAAAAGFGYPSGSIPHAFSNKLSTPATSSIGSNR